MFTVMVGFISAALLLASAVLAGANAVSRSAGVTIQNTDPGIFYHGRWDTTYETWW